MAFNPNDYVKPAAKPFVQRAIDPVVSSSTSGRAASTRNVAQSMAESLFVAGAAGQSVESQTSTQAEVLMSSVSDEYYALANKNIARVSRSDLSNLRKGNTRNSQAYINRTVPSAKIAKARAGKTIQVITVR